jgi:hypothetical protein
MFWYELANKSQAYYHTPASLGTRGWATITYQHRKKERKKRKALFGRYLSEGMWHYAVSCKSVLEPKVAFSLKSHIVFTNTGFETWQDKKAMHNARRAKGRTWFNEEWRDLQLAFLQSLRNTDGRIEIPLNKETILHMSPFTEQYWSDFGYMEPKGKERMDVLSLIDADEDGEEDI